MSATWEDGDGNVIAGPTESDDVFNGDLEADVINGLGGDDTITGNAGDDELSGGDGDDQFVETGRTVDGIIAALGEHDLAGHWKLGDAGATAIDETGTQDGTYVNGVGLGVAGAVDGSDAADFDGADDFVRIDHHASQIADAGTWQIWFNADDTSGTQGIWSKDAESTDQGGHMLLQLDGDELELRMQTEDDESWIRGGSVSSDGWNHVAVTFGDDGMRLYLNGEQVAQDASWTTGTAGAPGDAVNDNNLFLGGSSWRADHQDTDPGEAEFNGTLDHFAIINGQLDADAIADLFAAGSVAQDATEGTDDDVIDGGAGTDTVDFSGAGGAQNVDLANESATGAAGNDTLRNVENVIGTDFDDSIVGDAAENELDGGTGDDGLAGGDGDDVLSGGRGEDTVTGGAGDDVITGGGGDDALDGGAGDDRFVQPALAGSGMDVAIAELDPVGHWPLGDADGEPATDAVGDQDGTYVGGTTGVTGAADDSTGISLDGSNDFVRIDHAPELVSDSGTWQMWFNASETSGTTGLWSKDATSQNEGGHMLLNVRNGELELRMQTEDDETEFRAGDVDEDTWHHVAVTFGDDGLKLYLDGAMVGQDADWTTGTAGAPGDTPNQNHIFLGAQSRSASEGSTTPSGGHFEGTLDHFAVFDSQLDDAAIGELFAAQAAPADPAGITEGDTIDGGAGVDTVDYSGANGAQVVDLAAGTSTGAAGNDTLASIENVIGTDNDDTISGDSAENELIGGAGNDVLDGAAGDDVVDGGSGNDTLTGGAGDDVLTGGSGVDDLDGGAGDDRFVQPAPSGGGIETSIADNEPVGHWTLGDADGDPAADSVGSQDGTYVGGVTTEVAGAADGSSAVSLDGNDDYVRIDHAPEFVADSGTWQMWFNSSDTSGTSGLWSKDASSQNEGGHMMLNVRNGELELRMQSEGDETEFRAGDVDDDTWHHVAVTFGDEGLKLYLDGVMVGQDADWTAGTAGDPGDTPNQNHIFLGAQTRSASDGSTTPSGGYFEGELDHFAIFDSQLDDAAIGELFAAQALPAGSGAVTEGDTIEGGDGYDTVDYSAAETTIDADLTAGVVGQDSVTGVEAIVTGSGDDAFAFTDPIPGTVYSVDGGAGVDRIDLSQLASSAVTFSEGRIYILESDGTTWAIEHAGIESIAFSDLNAQIIDGDTSVDDATEPQLWVVGDIATRVEAGDGSFDLSWNDADERLEITDVQAGDADDELRIQSLGAADPAEVNVTIPSSITAIVSDVDLATVRTDGPGSAVETISVAGGDGRIESLELGGGGIGAAGLTIDGNVGEIDVDAMGGTLRVTGDLDRFDASAPVTERVEVERATGSFALDHAGDSIDRTFDGEWSIVWTAADGLAGVPRDAAGVDGTTNSGDEVTLEPRALTGASGDPLTVVWSHLSGPDVTGDLSGSRPTFSVGSDADGQTISFRVVIADGDVSLVDTVSFFILPATPVVDVDPDPVGGIEDAPTVAPRDPVDDAARGQFLDDAADAPANRAFTDGGLESNGSMNRQSDDPDSSPANDSLNDADVDEAIEMMVIHTAGGDAPSDAILALDEIEVMEGRAGAIENAAVDLTDGAIATPDESEGPVVIETANVDFETMTSTLAQREAAVEAVMGLSGELTTLVDDVVVDGAAGGASDTTAPADRQSDPDGPHDDRGTGMVATLWGLIRAGGRSSSEGRQGPDASRRR
ncbi:MAG: LamG-like jellyroll fold domain-containing protein [Phycisphaerales bacterium]